MNGIIDLFDLMSGSQLYHLPKVTREKILENPTEKAYINQEHNGK